VDEFEVELEDSTESVVRMRHQASLHRRIPFNPPNVGLNVCTARRICNEAGEKSKSRAIGLDRFLWEW
jgi:hypothetical protein